MLMNFFRSEFFRSMLIVVISILRAYDIAYIFIKSFSQATPVQSQGRSSSSIFLDGHPNCATRIRLYCGKEMFNFKL